MKPAFVAEHRAEYAKIRERIANKQPKAAKLSYAEAIDNGLKIDWDNQYACIPNLIGTQSITHYPLETLLPYFDWTPFFISWSLAGKFPKFWKMTWWAKLQPTYITKRKPCSKILLRIIALMHVQSFGSTLPTVLRQIQLQVL